MRFKTFLLCSMIFACEDNQNQRECEPTTNFGCSKNQSCIVNENGIPKCAKLKTRALKIGDLCEEIDDCDMGLSCIHFFGMNRCLPSCSLDVSVEEGTNQCKALSLSNTLICEDQALWAQSQCISYIYDRPDIGFCVIPCRPWRDDCRQYGDEYTCQITPELPFAICMSHGTQDLNDECGGSQGNCKNGLHCIQQGKVFRCANGLKPDEICGNESLISTIYGASNLVDEQSCQSTSQNQEMQIYVQPQDLSFDVSHPIFSNDFSIDLEDISPDLTEIQQEHLIPFSSAQTKTLSQENHREYRFCTTCGSLAISDDELYLCLKPIGHDLFYSTSTQANPNTITDFKDTNLQPKSSAGCYAWQADLLGVDGIQFQQLSIRLQSTIKPQILKKLQNQDVLLWLNGIALKNEQGEYQWFQSKWVDQKITMIPIESNLLLPKAQAGQCLGISSQSAQLKSAFCQEKQYALCLQRR